MFLGKKNDITENLVNALEEIFPVELTDLESDYITVIIKEKPEIIFINVMDLDHVDDLPIKLNEILDQPCLIGIQCFQNEIMVNQLKEKGYQYYASVFTFEENVIDILEEIKVKK